MSDAAPAAASASPPAPRPSTAAMNGDSSQASEPTPVDVTKKNIRINMWKQVKKNPSIRVPSFSFNRIPWVTGPDDPVEQLKEMSEFKNAKNILIGYDKAQESIKLACLQAGKNLYVQVPRLQKSLMTCLKMKEDATEENFQEALTLKGLEEYGTLVGLDDEVAIDLVIIGSIAVAKNGIRIGRGGGYVDMYLSVLQHLKIITPSTLIITTVHDSQVLESIPSNIIGAHDFPVDLIVTSTQVLRPVYKRPASIVWNVISQHQLQTNQFLAQIRDKEIQNGNECALKSVDDSERGENGGPRRYFRGRWGNRRFQGQQRYRRPQTNGVHSESENHEGPDGESTNIDKQDRGGHRRKFYYRRRRPMSAKDTIKGTFRDKAWYSLRANKALTTPRYPYYRIPGFKGAQDAALLLRQQEAFKDAKNVLVSIEKMHEGIRLACLEEGKGLYILNPKPQKEMIIRIDVPKNLDDEAKIDLKNVASGPGIDEYGSKLDLSEPVSIDLWVVGSVAISVDGCHIGKGNGSLDICYGYLSEKNVITSNTKIFTTVHDQQVFPNLPAEILCEYDIPVNVIVTPTQVIDVTAERKPSPGILWELISERLLARLPFLNDFREKEMLAGKPCILRVEDPEEYKKRNSKSNEHSESEHNEITEGVENGGNRMPRKKRVGQQTWRRVHRRNHNEGENDESGNISPDTTSNRPKRRVPFRRPKLLFDFTIKLTSIDRSARIRDLKTSLNDRNVKPNFITWKGSKGFCFLHFQKGTTSAGVERETELTADSILGALSDLTLQPTPDLTDNTTSQVPVNKVYAEIAKPFHRIETADETAV